MAGNPLARDGDTARLSPRTTMLRGGTVCRESDGAVGATAEPHAIAVIAAASEHEHPRRLRVETVIGSLDASCAPTFQVTEPRAAAARMTAAYQRHAGYNATTTRTQIK
jgi:hypothetical protein